MTFKQIVYRLNRRDFRLLPKFSIFLKVFLVILLAFTAIITTKTILAQEINPIKEKQDAIKKGGNQEFWLDNGTGANLMSGIILIDGYIPDEIFEGSGINPDNAYMPGGLIGFTNQVIAYTYSPTASGVEYIAEIKNNFLGKPAYAANQTGFNGLKPIMSLWKVFRNIVYVLISLYFVVLGIIIMLRVKISPQAVVTIQSSLPKIITTLVLVTFSYAIAGLCIDFMNVFQYLSISLLYQGLGRKISEGAGLFPVSWKQWSLTNLFHALVALFPGGEQYYNYDNISNPNFWMIKDLIQRLAPNSVLLLLGGVIGTVLGSFAGPAGLAIGFAAGGLLITLIISILVVVYLFKLCFGLTKTYINIILQIIFSPFLIFIGIFPTSKKGFSDWLLNLIANLAVFPTTLIFLLIANLLVDALGKENIIGGISTGLWAPNLVQGPFAWFLPTIVGISAIAMLSKIPQIVPEAIFGIKPSPLGKALGEGFGTLPGAGLVNTFKTGTERAMGQGMAERASGRIKSSKVYNAANQLMSDPRGKYDKENKQWVSPDDTTASRLNPRTWYQKQKAKYKQNQGFKPEIPGKEENT